MALSYLQYDVFTPEPLSGNQLAVFLDGRGLSDALMQAIAKEMNFSESTFILPPEQAGTDVRMRIFTPAAELPMAGHPTIGSTFALAHAGVINPGRSRFVFGLGVGPTPVDLEWNGTALSFAAMTQSNPIFGHPITDRESAVSAIGLELSDLATDLPIQEVSCGLPYLLVPLRDHGTVDRAQTNLVAYRKLIARNRLSADTCVYLFSTSSPDPAATTYSRMFAPAFGVPEDPATGSAAGPLACYLVRHGIISGPAAQSIVNLQGVKMGRPSRMQMSITERGGQIVTVKVGGEAVLVGRGELFL